MSNPLAAASAEALPLARTVRRVLLLWGLGALGLSASGVLESPPPPLIPLLIWSGPLAFLILLARSQAFRAYILSVDLRPVVLFHAVRAPVGGLFLVLHQRGELPARFALPAGWGDIAVGFLALLAVLALPAETPARRRAVLLWNALGLLDILMVFVTAQQLVFLVGDTSVLVTLTRFPFSLLPLFIVPLVFITHFTVMARLWGELARGRRDVTRAG